MNNGGSESVSEEEQEIKIQQGIPQIPFDLFVKKTRNRTCFTDGFGNLVYNGATRVLFDCSGDPLISIIRSNAGSWKAFKGDENSEELLCRVEQTLNTFSKIEFNVFLIRQDGEDYSLTMRGCLYWRSCTIYQDKSVVAQVLCVKLETFTISSYSEKTDEVDGVMLFELALMFAHSMISKSANTLIHNFSLSLGLTSYGFRLGFVIRSHVGDVEIASGYQAGPHWKLRKPGHHPTSVYGHHPTGYSLRAIVEHL